MRLVFALRRLRRSGVALLVALAALAAPAARAADGDGFFFIHLSDPHVYRHSSQIEEHYGLGPAWTPRVLLAYFALRGYERLLVPTYADAIVPLMRGEIGVMQAGVGRSDLWDAWSYFDELLEPGSALGDAEPALRAAFAEVHALGPAFVINTGDIVFDSGKVPPEISADWMALYREASEAGAAPVHHTIGNHELGLVEREGASPDDPLYGPGFFRHHFGPSTYAFDRGAFHFVALDTHSPDPEGEGWRWNRMRPEVRAWVEADLARHRDRVLVLLNHEPFFRDERWNLGEEFDARDRVDEEGLLERYGVDYTLTGHIHLPGATREGSTTHIATGALSGMHWVLPPEAAPRGYRLYWARGRELFTAWKETGKPVVGFVRPAGAGRHFPASGPPAGARDGGIEVVAVAADAGGAFADVRLEGPDGRIELERWGDYFVRARLPGSASGATLRLVATRAAGDAVEAEIALP